MNSLIPDCIRLIHDELKVKWYFGLTTKLFYSLIPKTYKGHQIKDLFIHENILKYLGVELTHLFIFAELCDLHSEDIVPLTPKPEYDRFTTEHIHYWNKEDTERFTYICTCDLDTLDLFLRLASEDQAHTFWEGRDLNILPVRDTFPTLIKGLKGGYVQIETHDRRATFITTIKDIK